MSVVVECATNTLHRVASREADPRVVVTACGIRIALVVTCGRALAAGPRVPCEGCRG